MKRFIAILLIIIGLPAYVHAAWWNPADWFSSTKEVKPVVPKIEVTLSSIATSTKSTIVGKVIEKTIPVERIIQKEVIIKDQSVVADNLTLRARIADLESTLNQCFTTVNNEQIRNTSSTTGLVVPVQNPNDPNNLAIKNIRIKEMAAFIQAQINQIDIDIIKYQSGLNNDQFLIKGCTKDCPDYRDEIPKKVGELQIQKLKLQNDILNLSK